MSNKKRLLSNFLSLSSIQAVNYMLPLITVPYLVRILGPDRFGLIALSQAFIQYFILITDYGFRLSATREISINRGNLERISEIFCAVMFIKIALMIFSFIILSLLVFNIRQFASEWPVYLFGFGLVLGNVLLPTWLFQGMERMKEIALLNIVSKAFFTISIFGFIRVQADYVYVPLINSIGGIVAGLLSMRMARRDFKVRFTLPALIDMKHQLKEGWHIFISTLAISLYTVSNTVILGLFTNNTIVGYYSAGEKIVGAVQGVIGTLSQTIYPHISRLASESKEAALAFIKKIVKLVVPSTFLISLALFIFAPQISDIILGKQFKESIPVIHILAFLPFIIGLSNIFAVQGLYVFGLYSIVARFVSIIAILHLCILIILTKS